MTVRNPGLGFARSCRRFYGIRRWCKIRLPKQMRFVTIVVMTVRSTVKHIDWLRATEALLNCSAIVCGGRGLI